MQTGSKPNLSSIQPLDTPTLLEAVERSGSSRLVSREFTIEASAPFTLARAAAILPQIAWADVANGRTWIGLGAADEVSATTSDGALAVPDLCRERLVSLSHPELRYFGGIAFDPGSPVHPAWPAGLPARFVLPELTLRWDEARPGTAQVIALVRASAEDTPETLEQRFLELRERVERWAEAARAQRAPVPRAERLADQGDRDRWAQAIRQALAETASVPKVVLSREIRLRSLEAIDPWAVLDGFSRTSPGHRFCFRFDAGSAFVGATPERLISVTGDRIMADGLAGTRRRGRDAAEDALLASMMLADDKERREHDFVVRFIREGLAPLCASLTIADAPTVLRTPTVQHLYTPVTGRLDPDTSLKDVLSALYPTPAVCGTPREAARASVRRLEGRVRGWYAGAVGWVGADACDFAVGIRSAMIHPQGAIAVTGCGIVPGSDPDAEYEETERKASGILSILEGRPE
ncbi:MAG TPA: isochorismate synthase [Pantanalinema sp.]